MEDVKDLEIIKKVDIDNEKKIKILKKIGKILIIVLFVITSTFIALKHEHWSDEAQSFLLARDNSLIELFGYMKYEGTPPLWVLVLKLFIILGGTYETLFILPILFSTIGLIIFEFKIKAPWYIKVLFPFTYFIFYQYSIVARSYCMIFPMLMLIASIYEKRLEKPILYAVILFFFMNISLHTLVISGSLYLIFLIDVFKNKKFKDKKIIIASVLIFFTLLLACICTIPAKDSYIPKYGRDIEHVISEATIGSKFSVRVEIVVTLITAGILIFTIKKRQVVDLFILILPVTAILIFIVYQCWHVGIIWLLIFTICIINNSINENIVTKMFILIVCLTQLYWTISSANYDINNKYSASKDVAEFLKDEYFDGKTIYGFGYGTTAIQPYFDYNVFENRNTDKSFHFWKLDNGYMDQTEAAINQVDVYVVSDFDKWQYGNLMGYLARNGYYKYGFEGNTYIKDGIFESESYHVYVKIEGGTNE